VRALRRAHKLLRERLPFPLLVQGTGSRSALLARFRELGNAVLLGSASFREGVDVRSYRVIYRAIEDMRDALIGMLTPDIVEQSLGTLEVRETFRASRIGTIAGCYVTEGMIRRGGMARLLRDGTQIFEGRISSLKRFKDDAREVASGFECGIGIEGFNDVKIGDVLEVFETREIERTSLDEPA